MLMKWKGAAGAGTYNTFYKVQVPIATLILLAKHQKLIHKKYNVRSIYNIHAYYLIVILKYSNSILHL